MYSLSVDQDVVKEIKRYPPKQFKQVVMKLLSLQREPRPHDCCKLTGYDGPGYRVDQGEYRILYEVDDQAQHVTIFLVGHRKDIYKRLKRLG